MEIAGLEELPSELQGLIAENGEGDPSEKLLSRFWHEGTRRGS